MSMGIEWHVGEVTDNNDPDKLGRIKFKSDTLLDGDEYPEWVSPSFPFVGAVGPSGMFWVPPVGTLVEVEIYSGEYADIEVPDAKYRACFFNDVDVVPEEFMQNYPERMGWKTPSGHLLLFDDSDGNELVLLKHKDNAYVSMSGDGVIIQSQAGAMVAVMAGGDIVLNNAYQGGSNLIYMSGDGILLADKFSNMVSMGADQLQLLGATAVTVSAPSIGLDAGIVTAGNDPLGMGEFVPMGVQLLTWLTTPGTIVDSTGGNCTVATPPPTVLSTQVKTAP